MGEVSRRNFLKGALAVGAVGVAGTALAGCSGSGAAASDAMPTKWDKEVEVLVIGAGSGLAAGVKAAEAGADTLIIEKADHPGGFWMASGGGCTMGGNNIVQQRAGETDDNETWFQDEMFSCSYRGDADIMRTLVHRGAETVQWMEDLGLKWGDLAQGFLRGKTKRGLWPVENPGVYVGGWGTGKNAGLGWTQVWENR